jgi:hypothetical protein
MEKIFNPLDGGKDRFQAKLDVSIQRQKSERKLLAGTTAVLAFGVVLATVYPKASSYFEKDRFSAPKKSELVLVTSKPGAKVFWAF